MAREKRDPDAVKKIYLQFVKLVSTISLPAFACIFMLSQEIIVLMFGERWAEAGWILRAFCVLGAVNCVAFFNGHVLMAMGDSRSYFIVLVQKTLLMTVMCVVGTQFGIEGVVAAVVLAGVLVTPISYRRMLRWIDVGVGEIVRVMSRGLMIVAAVVLAILSARMLLQYEDGLELIVLGAVVIALLGVGFIFSRVRMRIST